jgi:hypothetical protein
MNGTDANEHISLRELARRLGVTDKAVRNAVASGRLRRSIGKDAKGWPVVVDPELATIEWKENAGKPSARAAAEPARAAESAPSAPSPAQGELIDTDTLVGAQRMATIERGRKLKMENDLREGRLLEADKVRKEAFEGSRIIREAILNIPDRLAAELAAEADAGRVHLKLSAALREALNMAADTLLASAANE